MNFLSMLFIVVLLQGCGGAGGTEVGNKDGATPDLNIGGPKNAANPDITGTTLNLSDPGGSSGECQGLPPILPDPPPAVIVAPIPSGDVVPVSNEEVAASPDFSLQGFASVKNGVSQSYPTVDLKSTVGKRVLFDSLQATFSQAGNSQSHTRGIWDAFKGLSTQEKIVALLYPEDAYACRFSREEANQMVEKVFEGHKWEEDDWRGNAFRHMYWNMLMCYEGSILFADAMATAHEIPTSNEHGEWPPKQHHMDLHNNEIGRKAWVQYHNFISSPAELLAAQFSYVRDHPYEWFDGRANPQTDAPVYLIPPPEPPAPDDIVVSESQLSDSANSVGFYRGGTPRWWWESTSHGQEGHMYWTYSNGSTRDNWGLWRPQISSTHLYEVYAYIPDYYASTKSASYEIHHADGVTVKTISQYDISNRWESLGTYRFNAGTDGCVILSDNTGEPVKKRWVGFDSLKWVAR